MSLSASLPATVAGVVARLRAACPDIRHVDHAMTSAIDHPLPSALVALARVSALEEPRLTGPHAQMHRARVSVWILLPRRQDGVTDSAAADFDDLLDQVIDALVEWPELPPPGATRFWSSGGELAPYRDGLIGWRADFDADFDLRV